MRKASRVLGIIGGCLALVVAFICLLGGLFLLLGGEYLFTEITNLVNHATRIDGPWNWMNFGFIGTIGGIFILFGAALATAAGILGLIGASSVEKNNTKAGVLMLVSAGLCLLTGIGFYVMILLLLGGIFALVKEKPAQSSQTPSDS